MKIVRLSTPKSYADCKKEQVKSNPTKVCKDTGMPIVTPKAPPAIAMYKAGNEEPFLPNDGRYEEVDSILNPRAPAPVAPIMGGDEVFDMLYGQQNTQMSPEQEKYLYQIERTLMNMENSSKNLKLGAYLKGQFFGTTSIRNQPIEKLKEFLVYLQKEMNGENAPPEPDPTEPQSMMDIIGRMRP